MSIGWLHDLPVLRPRLEHERVCYYHVRHHKPSAESHLAPPATALIPTTVHLQLCFSLMHHDHISHLRYLPAYPIS